MNIHSTKRNRIIIGTCIKTKETKELSLPVSLFEVLSYLAGELYCYKHQKYSPSEGLYNKYKNIRVKFLN